MSQSIAYRNYRLCTELFANARHVIAEWPDKTTLDSGKEERLASKRQKVEKQLKAGEWGLQ